MAGQESKIAAREFLKSVVKEYRKSDSVDAKDARNQVYELLEREKQYMDARMFDEQRIEELEAENIELKEKINMLSGKKGRMHSSIIAKEEDNTDYLSPIKEKIEELEQVCIYLEEKGMTKPLKAAEAKLEKLKKRIDNS